MAGIAGLLDRRGGRTVPAPALRRMAQALAHRGPYASLVERPGVGLAWRHPYGRDLRCADRAVVCQSRLTNAADLERRLAEARLGPPAFLDADLLLGLWEQCGLDMLQALRGPFAFALWDERSRRLLLARDRVGCAPLYWAERDGWLLFGSEIKAFLASRLVRAEADPLGIDTVFHVLGLPAARTCFRGVQALPPGHYLLAEPNKPLTPRRYWDLDFPDQGREESGPVELLTDRLEQTLLGAVARRLEGPEAVASYISGGIDCSTIAALASKARGRPLPTFTVRLDAPELDESERACRAAHAGGSEATVVDCSQADILAGYQRTTLAAEHPVLDPSCVSLMLLAERARADGHRLVLTGDGADDLFAGYPWFRFDRALRRLDVLPGLRLSQAIRRLYLWWQAPHIPWGDVRRSQALLGGHHAWLDFYGLVSLNRSRFYLPEHRDSLAGHPVYGELLLNLERMRRWHPLNQALYLGFKVHVPGLLLQAKGDRIAMQSGVQIQSPFLDEDVLAFVTRLAPQWKLCGQRDKYLLRRVAERFLPKDIAWRPKVDFVARFDSLYNEAAPPWVEELLSDESLRRAGYFQPAAVTHWRRHYQALRPGSTRRISVEIGLAGVVATQLWHHTFIDDGLADLPSGLLPPPSASAHDGSCVRGARL